MLVKIKDGDKTSKCISKNPVVVEYTAMDTPQQNSPVKVALANKAPATMHHTNLSMKMPYTHSAKTSLQ